MVEMLKRVVSPNKYKNIQVRVTLTKKKPRIAGDKRNTCCYYCPNKHPKLIIHVTQHSNEDLVIFGDCQESKSSGRSIENEATGEKKLNYTVAHFILIS